MPNLSRSDFVITLKWCLCFFTVNMESTKTDQTFNKIYKNKTLKNI